MGRKKCRECLTCFNVFWVEGKRYYHCWLCNKTYEGRDDNLQECEDPRALLNIPIELEEQQDEPI
jgi:hypothetical protein